MGKPDLKSLVTQVVEDHRAYKAAMDKERDEKETLLRWFLDEVRPALPALVSRVDAGFLGMGPQRAIRVGSIDAKLGEEGLLLEDGNFAALSRSPPLIRPVSIGTVVNGWDVSAIIEAVVDALERQAHGNKEKATQAIEEEAARLRAIAALVRGGK